jgi:hypothetical protein
MVKSQRRRCRVCWIVVAFANGGVIIAGSLMIILGADILMARRPALNQERASHE